MPDLSPSFFAIAKNQRAWARRQGIAFDRRCRVDEISQNLLRPLNEDTYREYDEADGDELADKFFALYSSAALACNVFDYWRFRPHIVGQCLNLDSATTLSFEQKHSLFDDLIPGYRVDSRRKVPNIDVEIRSLDPEECLAVECKFAEPYVKYARNGPAFTSTYFRSEVEVIWTGLTETKSLASDLNVGGDVFECLYVPQLIKTTLACQRAFGKGKWKLLYLWYEVADRGEQSSESQMLSSELKRFKERTQGEIPFVDMTWQALFQRLQVAIDPSDSAYLAYLRDRYFGACDLSAAQ